MEDTVRNVQMKYAKEERKELWQPGNNFKETATQYETKIEQLEDQLCHKNKKKFFRCLRKKILPPMPWQSRE